MWSFDDMLRQSAWISPSIVALTFLLGACRPPSACPCKLQSSSASSKRSEANPLPRTMSKPVRQCLDREADEPRAHDIEVVAGTLVLRVYADAFVALEPRRRVLAYHLSRAALHADATMMGQKTPNGRFIKELCEELALHLEAIDAALRPKVEAFIKQVIVHKGIDDPLTKQRMPLPISSEELASAVAAARKDGATFKGVRNEAQATRWLRSVNKALFEPQAPAMKQAASRLHADDIPAVVGALTDARAVASDAERKRIDALILLVKTGTLASVQTQPEGAVSQDIPVDVRMGAGVLGWTGAEGEFGAGVFVTDNSQQESLSRLIAIEPGFKATIPWAASSSNAGPGLQYQQAITLAGAGVPFLHFGQGIWGDLGWDPAREGTGLHLTNTEDALVSTYLPILAREYRHEQNRGQSLQRCLVPALAAWRYVRTSLGSSSQGASAKKDAASSALGEMLRAVRADLTGLMALSNSKVIEAGVLPDAACVGVAVQAYLDSFMLGLRGATTTGLVERASLQKMALVIQYALRKGAVSERERDGKLVLEIDNFSAFRAALADLGLAIDHALGTGNGDIGRTLAEGYALRVPQKWVDDAKRRAKVAGRPSRVTFAFPRIKPLLNDKGEIVDATVMDSLGLIDMALIDAQKRQMP